MESNGTLGLTAPGSDAASLSNCVFSERLLNELLVSPSTHLLGQDKGSPSQPSSPPLFLVPPQRVGRKVPTAQQGPRVTVCSQGPDARLWGRSLPVMQQHLLGTR